MVSSHVPKVMFPYAQRITAVSLTVGAHQRVLAREGEYTHATHCHRRDWQPGRCPCADPDILSRIQTICINKGIALSSSWSYQGYYNCASIVLKVVYESAVVDSVLENLRIRVCGDDDVEWFSEACWVRIGDLLVMGGVSAATGNRNRLEIP